MRIAVAAVALTSAVAVAQIAAQPDDDAALARTITQQQVQSGELVKPAAAVEHQAQTLNPDQMLALANTYEAEMRSQIENAETVRVNAYRAKDIIRMTCVDEKLMQMKEVFKIVEPRLVTVHMARHDELRLRAQYSMIQQAHERVRQLRAAIEVCMGDVLDVVSVGKIADEAPSTFAGDPSRPQNPGIVVDRPPEASSWQ